jgi:hypothetical protein
MLSRGRTRRWRSLRLLLAVALATLPLASVAFAETTSPGKSSVFVTQSGQLDTSGSPAFVIGVIAKGKRKYVLKLSVTCSVSAAVPAWISIAPPLVNPSTNLVVALPSTVLTQDCEGACVVNGTFWLDVDVNVALQKVPLEITATCNATARNSPSDPILDGANYVLTLAAELVKK